VMAPKAGQIELYPNLLASQDEFSRSRVRMGQ